MVGHRQIIEEVRAVLAEAALAAGHDVPARASQVPDLEGIDSEKDVWAQAGELRAYRAVREAELREIARQAALRGVALRREREARKRAEAEARRR